MQSNKGLRYGVHAIRSGDESMIPQCALCINEPVVMDALHTIWESTSEFNEHYGGCQDAARKYRCQDFMGKFMPRERAKHVEMG